MLECPSDHDDSCSQIDDNDHDDDVNEKKKDLVTSSNNTRSVFLTRQPTLYDDSWPKKRSIDENKTQKIIHNGEATLLEIERNKTLFADSKQDRLFSSERNKSSSVADKKYQSHKIHSTLPSDFTATTTTAQELHSISNLDNMKTTLPLSQTKTNTSSIRASITNKETQGSLSKIPIRTNSSSQSRSRSPRLKASTTTTARNRLLHSPTASSKIPVPVSTTTTTSKGAFRFFTSADRSGTSKTSSEKPSTTDSIQALSKTTTQVSPFTPITHRKTYASTDKTVSSAGNTPSAKHQRIHLAVSDDEEEESDTNNLKEDDLKIKLKEQKRYGKKTGELLNQLHENYEELLEKYAQAENTIDQLRFQPKIVGDRTPSSNASEGIMHFIQQPKMNVSTLRSSGIYHSTPGTPLSSIMRVPSSATSATTNTPAPKSASPANSGTIESIFFDESVPQTIIVQELTTPETVKLDLLHQTKSLGGKMKSFITLMDANQLSLSEQKQVYDTIKDDYEKLLKVFDRSKNGTDFSDIDFDADLNTELEMMKQLLKEIVTRITDNLLGKSGNGLDSDRQSGSQSSQVSARSSICNHGDLMDQYHKLLDAVNTGILDKENEKNSSHTKLPNGLESTKATTSPQLEISGHLPPTMKNQKQYFYPSGYEKISDDEQQRSQRTTPIQLKKAIESTSYDLEYNPLTSINHHHHQPIDDREAHIHDMISTTKKKKSPHQQEIQEYDNLENITKSQRKPKSEPQRKTTDNYGSEHELSPTSLSNGTHGAHYSTRSMRTRTSDYDSGLGTNNTTKLSRDSKLNTTMMDESHYQSIDEDRRRYTDEERETMSSVSSSRSSGSGAVSPGIPYNKYTERFDTLSSLKPLNESYRRKPTGQSEFYPSDNEAYMSDSFDRIPQLSSHKRKPRDGHPSLKSPQVNSHQSRSTTFDRSMSTESIGAHNYTSSLHRPQTAPQDTSKIDHHHQQQQHKTGRKYQTGFVHRQITASSSANPEKMYRSACYIDEPHTHRRSQDKLDQNQRQYNTQTNNLYLDPHTGTVYRYVPNKNQTSTVTYYQPASQPNSSTKLYKCADCGCMTTYQHRHHIHSTARRISTDIDDPGYESGNRKIIRHRHYIDVTSSDSDSEENPTEYDLNVLNEACERAKKVQHRSQTLSRHINRQLNLILATI
ncbi:unnamed protein product [Adineta steineri]|uniref:Uncharacterized protein n=1 Tax=Adineta steineri TaxID=433720 RepID=A0A819DZ04_9BILA|nr:unnamed protein product [Adineta steineri]CAF3841427.1 unnamed protein product [Adineta steineri]